MNVSFLQRGFTLIELMVTVALAAIVLSLAVPGYQNLILSSRMAAQANDFLAALNLARSEAVKRGARVTLCKSSNYSNSSPTCTGYWEQGWIIFVDANNNGSADAGEQLLRVHEGLTGSTLRGNTTILPNYVSFDGRGLFSQASGSFIGGTFTLCPTTRPSTGRSITLNITGRASISSVNCP